MFKLPNNAMITALGLIVLAAGFVMNYFTIAGGSTVMLGGAVASGIGSIMYLIKK